MVADPGELGFGSSVNKGRSDLLSDKSFLPWA